MTFLLSLCLIISVVTGVIQPAHATMGNHEMIIGSGAYDRTVTRWNEAIQSVHPDGHDITWIGALSGNGTHDRKHRGGSRSTIIYSPDPGALDSSPVDIIFFFHGLRGFGSRDFRIRILPRVHQLSKSGHNFLLVVPEMPWSQNTRTPTRRQSKAWAGTKGENIVTFYQSVNRVLGTHFFDVNTRLGEVIMVGHSAGGAAIRMAASSGGLNVIKPNRLVFSDAGYGTWTSQTWKHFVAGHPETQWVILVRKWDTPYRNTVRFLKWLKRTPGNIMYRVYSRRTHTHTMIGDESLLWSYPKGR